MPLDKQLCVFIARHGATVLNQNGRFRGNANPPLASEGIQEAHRLAHYFSNIDISAIFSSDRTRATSTADIISKSLNVPVHTNENLRALNVGSFSGQKRTPEAEEELQKYIDDPDTCIPDGESMNNFKARVRPCLLDAVDLYLDCGIPPLIVAHSSIVHELGAMFYGDHKTVLVHPGGVAAIFIDNGKLGAEAIYKPVKNPPKGRAQTVS